MPNLDIKEAESRLNAIARLRLLFNTNRELNEFIGFKVDGNNSLSRIGGENAFLKNAVYDSLCNYAEDLTGVNFDKFLTDYISASEFFEKKNLKWLARKHYGPCLDLIKHVYGSLPVASVLDKVLAGLLPEIYTEDTDKQHYNVPILILLALGLLPLYTKGRGDITDIKGEFSKLFEFLEPLMKDNIIFTNNQTFERWKENMADDDEASGRLLLYLALTDILDSYVRCTDHKALYLSNLDIQNSVIFPLGDTIWKEDETTYWKFKELDNGYFATRYKISGQYRRIEFIRYEMVFFVEDNKTYAYVIDPRGSFKLMRGKKVLDSEFELFEVDMSKAGERQMMTFFSSSNTNCLDITSLTETEISIDDFKQRYYSYTFVDKYPEASYKIVSQLAAVTMNSIYIPDGKEGFYRVPKSVAPVLRHASVDDNGGLFEIPVTKEKIIGFVDQGIYINVTYPVIFEQQGIRPVDSITAD